MNSSEEIFKVLQGYSLWEIIALVDEISRQNNIVEFNIFSNYQIIDPHIVKYG